MDKIYVTDLDGTLFNLKAEITEFCKETLTEFLENERLAFFTARSYHVARKKLGNIPFNVPCAVLNGCYIVDYLSGEVYQKNILDFMVVKQIIELALERNIIPIVICQCGQKEKMLYGDYYNSGYREYIIQRRENNDNRLQSFDFRSNVNILSEMDCLTLQFIDYEDKLLELKKAIDYFEVNCYLGKELYCKDAFYLNVTPLKATKEESLRTIAQMMGITLQNFVVFGDQENDIGMFEISGESCAVENAIETLKDISTRVIDSNENDGVAKYLKRIMLQGGENSDR